MNSFGYWKQRFDNNDHLDFSQTDEGVLWLKLRSIDRKDLLKTCFGELRAFYPLLAKSRMSISSWTISPSISKSRICQRNMRHPSENNRASPTP